MFWGPGEVRSRNNKQAAGGPGPELSEKVWIMPAFTSLCARHHSGHWKYNEERPVFCFSGSYSILMRSLWQRAWKEEDPAQSPDKLWHFKTGRGWLLEVSVPLNLQLLSCYRLSLPSSVLIWVEDMRKKTRIIDAIIPQVSLGYLVVGQGCLFAFVLWIVSFFEVVSCGAPVLCCILSLNVWLSLVMFMFRNRVAKLTKCSVFGGHYQLAGLYYRGSRWGS